MFEMWLVFGLCGSTLFLNLKSRFLVCETSGKYEALCPANMAVAVPPGTGGGARGPTAMEV